MKKSYIGKLMIVIGAIIIFLAFFMRYQAHRKQTAMIEDFKQNIQQTDKQLGGSDNNSTAGKKINKRVAKQDTGTIGIMSIPKIDLDVALSEGVDADTLKYAVGHFKGTPMPGNKGNFCVAGHRSYTYNEYFNRLDELKIGDVIIVTTRDGEFKYKVYETKVVKPEEVSVLNNTEQEEITLVTCTPIRVATHRLIVKGRLINNI